MEKPRRIFCPPARVTRSPESFRRNFFDEDMLLSSPNDPEVHQSRQIQNNSSETTPTPITCPATTSEAVTAQDHKNNSVSDGSFGTVKVDSSDDDEKEKENVVKLVYKLQKQSDASKDFNVDTKEDVIEKENVDVSSCKDDVLMKKDYDGDGDNGGTNGGTRNVGDELVEDISADKVVDSINISSTINLNYDADTPIYSKMQDKYL
ncbi:conserved hypothetical protein [Ricinus communis]|uniref:Uncharacterized protein n=1 Tax=Ricinus communis TaxID=3988 RepID=B9SG88_RICCO|nr:conserved hypothetical protein [Ricinus communis]